MKKRMMKMKAVWKRFLLWIGAAILALSAVACAARPDGGKQPYVSMDTIQLLEAAHQNAKSAGHALSEKLCAPARYAAEPLAAADGRLMILLDAEVHVPDAETMPIYRVAAGAFDAALIDRAFSFFCGGRPMYDYANFPDTREHIQTWIDTLKSDLENEDFPDGGENAAYWRERYTQELAEYEKRLPGARDDLGPPVTEAVLGLKELGNGGTRESLLLIDAPKLPGTARFSVSNNMQYPFNEARYFPDAGGGITAAPRSNASLSFMDENGWERGAQWQFVRKLAADEAVEELPLTQAQALGCVREMLAALGLSDTLYPSGLSLLTKEGSGKYAYSVDMRRRVNGVDVRSPFYATYVGDPTQGFEWHYEYATAYVNEDGLLYFSWKAPLEVLERTVEDAKLLSFDELMEVARSMLPVVLTPDEHYFDYYARMEVRIEEIALSLQRSPDQSSVTTGLLIPVWNFFGTTRNYFADGSEDMRDKGYLEMQAQQSYALLSVNAIDGSVISGTKGF